MTVLETERKNLKTLSDEELVKAAQSGDDEALEAILSRYKNLVYAKSKPYFLAGADDDDIIQEGLIGLYKAVMDFDGDRFPFFKVFAGVCVTRHIITAVKAASRKKHLPLNSYVSLDKNTYDDDSDTTLLDIIAFSELQDPEASFEISAYPPVILTQGTSILSSFSLSNSHRARLNILLGSI